MRQAYLTTIDNPFDPRNDFDNWYSFDTEKQYNTCSYLARIAKTSEGLSDLDNWQETERAIDEILSYNLLGNYKKLVYDDDKLIETVVGSTA